MSTNLRAFLFAIRWAEGTDDEIGSAAGVFAWIVLSLPSWRAGVPEHYARRR